MSFFLPVSVKPSSLVKTLARLWPSGRRLQVAQRARTAARSLQRRGISGAHSASVRRHCSLCQQVMTRRAVSASSE